MLARRASRPRARHAVSKAVLVGVSALVLVFAPLPASAEPSSEELRAADRRVAQERARLSALTARAAHAAEAYNGAKVLADRAQTTSARAGAASARAEAALVATQAQATAAQAAAQQAADRAVATYEAQLAAEAEAKAVQVQLDRIAVGAYRTNGDLAMVAAMMNAGNPLQLAQMHDVLGHVGTYQDHVIERAGLTRQRAQRAAAAAVKAQDAAQAALTVATAAVTKAEASRTRAAAAKQQADVAAAAAVRASSEARRARVHAMALVAQAEASLRRAVRKQKSLQQAAAEARAEARGYRGGSAPSEAARIAIHHAFEQIGVPYSWGGGDENGPTYGFAQGAGTKGFDCSGLTLYAYHQAGIDLDHWTGSQWHDGKRIWKRSELKPGDLMFFAYDTSNEDTIHHVSLYIGDGKMIEAPYTGEVVRVTSASRSDFIGATRPWVQG